MPNGHSKAHRLLSSLGRQARGFLKVRGRTKNAARMSEAIIIGAVPAGSFAAILLARGGWRVTLLEKHPFPRDKVCGECLSALGLSVLQRADLLTTLTPDSPVILKRANLH